MTLGVQGLRAELIINLLRIIVRNNLKNCRATILAAAYFQNTLRPQD